MNQPNQPKQPLPTASICPNCQHRYDFREVGYKAREVADGITDIGIECPNCHAWFHSYFINEELRRAQAALKQNGNRKQRRAYEAKFRKFQAKARKIAQAVATEAQ